MSRLQIRTCICERADLSIEISPLSGGSAGPRQTREPTVGITSCPLRRDQNHQGKAQEDGPGKADQFLARLACRALRPDVCLLHGHRADPLGNIQYDGKTLWPDVQIYPKACARTIVTVEEIVSEEEVRERPHETVIPHFAVDAVVLAPHGCHPTSFFPNYVYDEDFHESWTRISRDPEQAVALIDRLCEAESQDQYLEVIGQAALAGTRNWRELA